MAVAIVLQMLADKPKVVKFATALAKVYVAIGNAAELNPTLKGEIAKRGGLGR